MPATWQRQMILRDFDPMIHTLTEFVEFCEWLETADVTEKSTVRDACRRYVGMLDKI